MKQILTYLTITLFIVSCQTSNQVASNFGIQKRKYTKGFYIDKKSRKRGRVQNMKIDVEPQLAEESPQEEKPRQISVGVNEINNESQSFDEIKDEKISEKNGSTPLGLTPQKLNKRSAFQLKPSDKFRLGRIKPLQVLQQDDEDQEKDKILIGVLLCVFGLSPFGILIALGRGKGTGFRANLFLWITGILMSVAASVLIIVLTVTFSEAIGLFLLAMGLVFLGGIFMMISWIHGLIKILNAYKDDSVD